MVGRVLVGVSSWSARLVVGVLLGRQQLVLSARRCTRLPTTLGRVTNAVAEAARRRTFAVISHPDAGKSTLTEALALHARVINEAGHIHGKAGRKSTVSDWMDIEKARGISISSAALQFAYGDAVINLVDTPGHADFSEDTYRVLAAVDSAVMLVDAAKGMEPQTLKLFEVCRYRQIPVLTVINKWDRPGREALELMDEVAAKTGLQPTPLTWPVGIAGDFRGRPGPSYRAVHPVHPHGGWGHPRDPAGDVPGGGAGGARRRVADRRRGVGAAVGRRRRPRRRRLPRRTRRRRSCSGRPSSTSGSPSCSRRWSSWPRRPGDRLDESGKPRPVGAPFSAFVFKIQAGMDSAHRDRLAYMRVCSGVFERGAVVTHAASKKPFATKYAQQVFGQNRETVDIAYPGDVVGLVNASMLRVGDSLYIDEYVAFPPIPSFAPEHFVVARVDRQRPLQAVPPRHRAARAGGGRAGAALGPPRRPGTGPCRRRSDAVRGRAAPDGGRDGRTRHPRPPALLAGPPHHPRVGRRARPAERCRGPASAATVRCSRCSPTSGDSGRTQRDFPDAVLEPLVARQYRRGSD